MATRISNQLRAAIDASGMSRYALCKKIGMDQSVMSRFMVATGGLSTEMTDKLCVLLGLKLVATTKPTKSKGR